MLSLLPYLLFTAVYFVMRIYSLRGVMGISIPDVGLFSRLARNYRVIPQYIALLAFPADLTVCHNVPEGGLFSPPWFFPIWVTLLVAIGLIVRWGDRAALLGLTWYAINYLPVSNIVPIPSDPITERFLYLPAVGVFLVAGAGVARLYPRETTKRLTWTVTAIILIAFAALTVWRNLDWKDEYSLFASAVRKILHLLKHTTISAQPCGRVATCWRHAGSGIRL